MTSGEAPLLEIEGLTINIGSTPVVEDVSFSISAGRTIALVGESGCGKSLTALALLGLLPDVADLHRGDIRLDGESLRGATPIKLQSLRGAKAGMIFQEPVESLNPLMTIGEQVAEPLEVHWRLDRSAAKRKSMEILSMVGIQNPQRRAHQFPFELSGGMCQRVMIAMALVAEPKLLIADEPTTALDVTIQAQVLDLLKKLTTEHETTLLLITHDMGVVADIADRVMVMYAGSVVEEAEVGALFEAQFHPYTRLLLETIPKLDGPRKTALPTIPGSVPDPSQWPAGCRFADRCPLARSRCRSEKPALLPLEDNPERKTACWYPEEVMERLR